MLKQLPPPPPQVLVQLPGRGGELPPQASLPLRLAGVSRRRRVARVLLPPAETLGPLRPGPPGPVQRQVRHDLLSIMLVLCVPVLTSRVLRELLQFVQENDAAAQEVAAR